MYHITEDIITLHSNVQAASPKHHKHLKGRAQAASKEPGQVPPAGKATHTVIHTGPSHWCSVLKSRQGTMFGVSWLNADRLTDYLSTSSMIVEELFTSTNKPSRGQKEKC